MPTVFITGGGGIIGPGMIHSFARAGYDVAASYNRREEATRAALESAEKEFGIRTLLLKGNNGIVEDIYTMFDQVDAVFGGLDCMVNNAGMTFCTDFLHAKQEDFDLGVNVDFRGTFFCMQCAANNMIKYQKEGVIINVSSNHQSVTFQSSMLYAASKAAIDRMTKSAAVYLAPYHIRVVDIVPGYTQRETFNEEHKNEPFYINVTSKIPTGRYATPGEMGDIAVFLASPSARSVNGTSLFVDGGAQNVTGVPG